MLSFVRLGFFLLVAIVAGAPLRAGAAIPDGRSLTPVGFTVPVESFSSATALSPDGKWLAVLSQTGGAVDVIDTHESFLVTRLEVPGASGMTWTADGLYVTGGYTGTIQRYAYADAKGKGAPAFHKRADIQIGSSGLLNGIAEDPATHRIVAARTADRQIVVIDDATGKTVATLSATGEPYAVALAAGTIFATMYNSDHVDAWRDAGGTALRIRTGPHPTAMLAGGGRVFVGDADGHDVAVIDPAALSVSRRLDLGVGPNPPPGQTPSGMALSDDGSILYVAESGFNDVAAVDLASGRVLTRIPTGWYPMSVAYLDRPTVGGKDPRPRPQLWIASALGRGSQPDPGGEWDGTYTGLVQHVVVEPGRFTSWSAAVARNDRFAPPPVSKTLPPIRHVVFIVRENKHFDEEFADEPHVNGDPALLLYGRKYTPNAHALAQRYTLFDDFMGNGESSDYGHAWATQGMVNDYHERNVRLQDPPTGVDALVAWSIWPLPEAGEDTVAPSELNFDWYTDLSQLPKGPRVNTSGVFGPRGELIDALQRAGVGFRVYGEQMTMLPSGNIAPGLAAHAAREYPGAHIDFTTLDTTRAQLFLADVKRHGLAQYSYLTLPTDHTAGSKAGFYTPASYVANNDLALGQIIAGLSRDPEWASTVVFVTTDDPQGTGDHVDSHRMPALAIGPYVRRAFVDSAHYSIPSILRTVEVLFGVAPLNVYDAAASPMLDAFSTHPLATHYTALPSQIPMEHNAGKATTTEIAVDGPDSAEIPDQEWASIKGAASLPSHTAYLRARGEFSTVARLGEP